VAKEAMKRFSRSEITAYYTDIRELQFSIFCCFAIVFNTANNVETIKHINLMCMAANIPLIDTSAAGLTGQITFIAKVYFLTNIRE
jgi:ubiquitin-like 1-activating enzyme E1 B